MEKKNGNKFYNSRKHRRQTPQFPTNLVWKLKSQKTIKIKDINHD